MGSCTEFHERIQLYVDGELAEEERELLFAHLDTCEQCTQHLESAEALSSRIRSARPSISAPDSLRQAVLQKMEAERSAAGPKLISRKTTSKNRLWSLAALAAGVALVAGTVLNVYSHRQSNPTGMIQTAVLAHRQLEDHTLPLDVSTDSSETATSWFASRVSFPFHMANAGMAVESRAKFKLTGGRLLSVGSDKVALLSFSLPHEVVSMLVGPGRLAPPATGKSFESDGVTFHAQEQGSLHVVTWTNRGLSYVLTSPSSMGNTRQCSTCHQPAPSDRVITHDSATLDRLYQQIHEQPMLADASVP